MTHSTISSSLLQCAKNARAAADRYLASTDGRVRRKAVKELAKADMLEAKAAEFKDYVQ